MTVLGFSRRSDCTGIPYFCTSIPHSLHLASHIFAPASHISTNPSASRPGAVGAGKRCSFTKTRPRTALGPFLCVFRPTGGRVGTGFPSGLQPAQELCAQDSSSVIELKSKSRWGRRSTRVRRMLALVKRSLRTSRRRSFNSRSVRNSIDPPGSEYRCGLRWRISPPPAP